MATLSSIIDRRLSKGKSAENRRKFLERVRESVKEAMPSILNQGAMKEIGQKGGNVKVQRKSIQEPEFHFGSGGDNDHVLPGNKEFVVGERLKKPQGGGGGGSGQGAGAGEGSGEDEFVVQISREEFLNFLFEDLELPDLVRKDLAAASEPKPRTAGFSTTGTPARLSVPRSMRTAHLRRIAMRGALQEEMDKLEEERDQAISEEERQRLIEELESRQERSKKIPFLDTMDLRFRSMVMEEKPVTHATMVCVMDNSGSMGEREKTLSRKFFYLLYLFLNRKYEQIELVFIHHTDTAKEVSEEEFFNTRESGGTKVSAALELMKGMIPARIDPFKTNVYVCQCSDGDNYGGDNEKCAKMLSDELMDAVQYWAYIQIEPEHFWETERSQHDHVSPEESLWGAYNSVSAQRKNLALRHVASDADIYPVFRKLFEKRDSASGGSRS